MLGQEDRGPDPEPVVEVVEDRAAVDQHPLPVGEVGVGPVPLRHPGLEPPDRAVAEVADQPADEGRGPLGPGEVVVGEQLAQRREGRGVLGEAPEPRLVHHHPVRPLAHQGHRLVAEEGVAAPPLAALQRLEEEGVRRAWAA